MKVLVTGGAGFIGSHLCETLLRAGHKVLCVDNFSTGTPENVQSFHDSSQFTLRDHDIRKPFKAEADYIFHLASPASPVDYQMAPLDTLTTNSVGTLNLLELARKNKTPIFIASTSEVYGDPDESPQKEEYWGRVNPVGPRSCYDESKRFGEALAVAFQKRYEFPVFLGRIFNTFGPRMRVNDGRVIPNFINQAIEGEPLTVYGDGLQTRSFCYISDLVAALMKILELNLPGLNIVNLGNPKEMTILDLAKQVKERCRSDSPLVFKPLPIDDPLQRNPDITRARQLLNWEPKVSLDEGLDKVIDWFVALQKKEKSLQDAR